MIRRISYLILVTLMFTSCGAIQMATKVQNDQKKAEAKRVAEGRSAKLIEEKDVYKPNGTRYRDKVFNAFDAHQEVFLTNLPTWDGKKTNLKIDIYSPKNDPNPKGRPCVIVYPGGAWISKGKEGFKEFNSELAMRGYVAITGDYRVGFPQADKALFCIGDIEKNMVEAAFRAFQDTRALVRHVRANAAKYGIDPNKIFVAGESAGGANAVGAVYFQDHEVPERIRKKIGDLESVGNYKNVSSKPNGIISFAGPLVGNPSVMEKQNVPVYLLQGQCDELIPWNYEKAFPYCNKTSKTPKVAGCNAMYHRLKEVGEQVWFDMVCGGNHGAFSSWGFVELNRRVANFCYLVMNNQFKTGEYIFIPDMTPCPEKKFPECEKWIKATEQHKK